VLRLADTGGGGALQTLAYRWHIRGGLRGINTDNNGNLLTDRLFAMKLDYETEAGYFNGNIKKQTWRSSHDGQERSYTYAYDPLSRLTGATGSEGVTTLSNIGYDVNGNIQTMQRAGVDNLSYTYQDDSNKLLSVSDSQAGTLGFVDGNTGSNDYDYWPDGSLKKDLNKQITLIEYNLLKLPRRVVFQSGQEVQYEYDAAGSKLKKVVTNGGNSSTTEYVGNQVWENGALYQIAHEEGRIVANAGTYRYEWSLQDHLGNNRVSFSNNGSGGAQMVQSQHYDPWGWELPGLGTSQSQTNRYTFLNREEQTETGWTDLMARGYDKQLGRFWQIDPVTEEQEHLSTYQYGWNNPVLLSDPNGDCPLCLGVLALFGIMTSAQPAMAPTHNPQADQRAYRQAYNEYGMSVGTSLLPGTQATKPSIILYQTAKGAVKATAIRQAQKAIDNTVKAEVSQAPAAAVAPSPRRVAAQTKLDQAAAGTTGGDTRFVSGASVTTDRRTGATQTGTVDVQPTVNRINTGGTFPHRNDGTTFQNRPDRTTGVPGLPVYPSGHYTEYVLPTHGVPGPGPQRIVTGASGEIYYTADHYQSFIKIK
jgi:RHS repeat-associated protein